MFLLITPQLYRPNVPWQDDSDFPSTSIQFGDDSSFWQPPVVWPEIAASNQEVNRPWRDIEGLPQLRLDEDFPWTPPVVWADPPAFLQEVNRPWRDIEGLPQALDEDLPWTPPIVWLDQSAYLQEVNRPWRDVPESPSQAVNFADDESFWTAPTVWADPPAFLQQVYQRWFGDEQLSPALFIDEDLPWVPPVVWAELPGYLNEVNRPWRDAPEIPSQAVSFADDESFWTSPILWRDPPIFLLPPYWPWQDDQSFVSPPSAALDEDFPWMPPVVWQGVSASLLPIWQAWQDTDGLPQLRIDEDLWQVVVPPWERWHYEPQWQDADWFVPSLFLDEDFWRVDVPPWAAWRWQPLWTGDDDLPGAAVLFLDEYFWQPPSPWPWPYQPPRWDGNEEGIPGLVAPVIVPTEVSTGGWLRREEIAYLRRLGMPARPLAQLAESVEAAVQFVGPEVSVRVLALPVALDRLEALSQQVDQRQTQVIATLRQQIAAARMYMAQQEEMEALVIILALTDDIF